MIARVFKYTPNQIAKMTPYQQLTLTSKIQSEVVTFDSEDDFMTWQMRRNNG